MQPTRPSLWFKPVLTTVTVLAYDGKPINYVRLEDVFSFAQKCEQEIEGVKNSLAAVDRQFQEQYVINERLKMDSRRAYEQCMDQIHGKQACVPTHLTF